MIDYIPPDIPPAVVQFANDKYKKPDDAKGRWFSYFTHVNNIELYVMDWNYTEPRITGYPIFFVYDCQNVHKMTKQEWQDMDIPSIYPKYISQYAKEEHICHRNIKAFNQHTKESDYNKKVKHITPKYIPQDIIDYVDKNLKDSWFPGTTKRYIKYLTTYNDKYEVYYVYWAEPFNRRKSHKRPLLYNCSRVSIPGITKWIEITNMAKNHNSAFFERPHLCTSD